MTDDWEDEEARPRRRGLPKGVWFACGCGCLVVGLALVGVLVFTTVAVRRGTDPERVWPRVQETLHFDERPEGVELEFGMPFASLLPFDQIVLRDVETGARIFVYSSEDPAVVAELMAERPESTPLGFGEPVEPETGTMEIQGREVETLRFQGFRGQPFSDELGPGVRLDLGRTDVTHVVVQLSRPGEPLTGEEVEEILAPFDLWRGR